MESGIDLKASLSISLQSQDLKSYTSVLESTSIHFTLLIDYAGFNIFHDLATSIIKEDSLIEFVSMTVLQFRIRYSLQSESILKEMMNAQSIKDKQTPLLMAVKHNRRRLVSEYLRLGADPRIKDINRHGPLHIAASQGRIALFVLFKTLGLDIEEEDSQNRMPLHLSSLEGQESMSLLIIAWSKNLEKKDCEGYTPLHMAAISQSYRIARHLIIRGASRDIRDNSNKTPLDHAYNKSNADLINLLETPGCLSGLNPCKAPIKPINSSPKHIIFYIFTFLARYAAVVIFLLPRFSIYFALASLILFILSSLLFLTVSLKDPGFIPESEDIISLYNTYKPEYLCAYCKVVKSKSVNHCQHCNRCVNVMSIKGFDHHCPWIKNCVGKNNHCLFIWFLTFCCLDFIFHSGLGLLDYFQIYQHSDHFIPSILENRIEASLAVSCFCVLALVLVGPLWFVQMTNLLKNTTTHQRYAYKVGFEEPEDVEVNLMLSNDEDEWPRMTMRSAGEEMDEFEENCCYYKRGSKRKIRMKINETTQASCL